MGTKDVFISYKTDEYEEARRVKASLEPKNVKQLKKCPGITAKA